MSGKKPSDRPPFELRLTDPASPISAMAGLCVALQCAVEAAIFPDRLKVDSDTKLARLETLTKELIHEAKNAVTEGVSETDDASGIAAVVAIINEIAGGLRDEIERS